MSDAGTLVTHFADGKLLQLCHQLVPVFLQCCYRLIGSTLRYKHAVETWKTWQTSWKYNLRSQNKKLNKEWIKQRCWTGPNLQAPSDPSLPLPSHLPPLQSRTPTLGPPSLHALVALPSLKILTPAHMRCGYRSLIRSCSLFDWQEEFKSDFSDVRQPVKIKQTWISPPSH